MSKFGISNTGQLSKDGIPMYMLIINNYYSINKVENNLREFMICY